MAPKTLRFILKNCTDSETSNKNAILILGETGSGKSSLVNLLTGQDSQEISSNGDSCQSDFEIIIHKNFAIVDSPGFCDNLNRFEDRDILRRLQKLIYRKQFCLKVIIICTSDRTNRFDGNVVRMYAEKVCRPNGIHPSSFNIIQEEGSRFIKEMVENIDTTQRIEMNGKVPGICTRCNIEVDNVYGIFSHCKIHNEMDKVHPVERVLGHIGQLEYYHPLKFEGCFFQGWKCCQKSKRFSRGCKTRYSCCNSLNPCQSLCANCKRQPSQDGLSVIVHVPNIVLLDIVMQLDIVDHVVVHGMVLLVANHVQSIVLLVAVIVILVHVVHAVVLGGCDRNTGVCGSCSGSWYGPFCDKPCPDHCWAGSCNRDTGCCSSCSESWVGNCTCSITSQCAKPSGVDCSWYSSCLEPDTASCPFILDTMQDKCQEYLDLEPSLSTEGQKWSAYVRSCLQNVLASTVLVGAPSGQVNCQTATNAFFDDHLNCYLKGPISFCHLPYSDIGRILIHGASILFSSHWYEPLITGTELKVSCDLDFWETSLINNFGGNVPDENHQYSFSDDPSVSFTTSLNQTLLPYQMMLTFVPSPNNTLTNTTSLAVLSNTTTSEPINSPLAIKLVTSTIQSWISQNPSYEVTFNGVNQ
eukprot:gene1219-1539_t